MKCGTNGTATKTAPPLKHRSIQLFSECRNTLLTPNLVPEPIEFNGKVITPQNLYTGLFIIGMLLSLEPSGGC